MAKKIKIEWIHEGFEQILCAPGTKDMVQNITSRIQTAANANNRRGGGGYVQRVNVSKMFGSSRANGSVFSVDNQAYAAETEDKALSRAVK